MLKKAAALFVICAGLLAFVSCGGAPTQSFYLYAAVPNASEIVAYREDPNSGFLTVLPISPITAGPGVESLVIHPSGKFIYAANPSENDISLFAVQGYGGLTEKTPRTSTLPGGTSPTRLVMDAKGTTLFASNVGSNSISVFTIDSKTGFLSPVTGSPFAIGITPLNMVVAPSGSYLYVTGSANPGVLATYAVNTPSSNCANNSQYLCLIQISIVGSSPYGIAMTPKGNNLYVANSAPANSISEFSVDSSSGLLTQLSGSPIIESYISPAAALVDNSGKYLYVANEGSANISAYAIAASGGGLTALNDSPFAAHTQPVSIAIDPAGRYIYVGNQSSGSAIQSFLIDSTTGNLAGVESASVGNAPTSIIVTP
jgi:6-phosphogluconolactonase